jgi:hypothetical protein
MTTVCDAPRTRAEKMRGWFALVILLGVVGVPLYAVYWISERITLQPDIERGGGIIQYEVRGSSWLKDWAGDNHDWLVGSPVSLVVGPRQKVDDGWVTRLSGMTSLRTLSLAKTRITDRGMRSLASLTHLEYLDLSQTNIGDAGLEQIRGLTKLKSLSLEGTQVSDEGLACLAAMNHLTDLDLSHTQVRGAGLKHLVAMEELNDLSLEGTDLDDAGLAQLPALPSLRELNLSSTRITSVGVRVLKGRQSINSLSICNTLVDDTAIEALSRVGTRSHELDYLKVAIDIQGTRITPRGMSIMRGADISIDHHAPAESRRVRLQWAALGLNDPHGR